MIHGACLRALFTFVAAKKRRLARLSSEPMFAKKKQFDVVVLACVIVLVVSLQMAAEGREASAS